MTRQRPPKRPECPLTHETAGGQGSRRAVFLDRDGVLIEDTGYPHDPALIALLPGVAEALRLLAGAGWRLVVVTNQAGVAWGRFSLGRLAEIHDRLAELLAAEGVSLDAIYYCPHHPEAADAAFARACDHRKPGPGMLRSAASQLALELRSCWMVGDKESDVQAGQAAGCRTIRIGEGDTAAERQAADLLEAARLILGAGATA